MKKEHLKFVIDSRCFRGSCITSMSDGIHCDYDGSTLEELKKQENNPFLIAVTRNTIHKKSRIYDRSLCRPFHEITEEDYYNYMNELPPIRLKHHSFFLGEPYHGSLYMFCFTIGKRFFRGLRPVMTPQTELERQMNEHYRNITFKGKITKGKAERITGKDKQEIITIPYSFTDKENRERFICNMVTGQNDGGDIRKARKDMANILISLRRHHFLYFSGYGSHDDMETFLDEVEKKRYTIVANGAFFQFPLCRDSVSFIGTVKETGETFFYRIYDRELFLNVLHRLRTVKRRKYHLNKNNPTKNTTVMKNTKSWKDYVPQSVSLYHADYRENLDEYEDLQDRCIRENSLKKLYERVLERYREQEADNLLRILDEIKETMVIEGRQEEFEKYYNEITELIRQRNDTDPIDSLIKNSSAINIFYSPGIEIEEHIGRESRAMSCYKIRRALKLKKGQFDTLIEELVDNATYGGELRIYFNAGFNELVTNDNGNDFRTIRFHGDVIVAVANSFNGSGHHISLPLDITFPFVRDRLFVDSQVRYSYATEVCGMCRDWCDSTSWETGYKTVGNTGRNRQKEETLLTN